MKLIESLVQTATTLVQVAVDLHVLTGRYGDRFDSFWTDYLAANLLCIDGGHCCTGLAINAYVENWLGKTSVSELCAENYEYLV